MSVFLSTLARAAAFTLVLGAAPLAASAEEHREQGEHHGGMEGGMARQPAPFGYHRFDPPSAIDHRPTGLNPRLFNREFAAHRAYRIGPFHAPEGFRYQRFRHGEILPAAFWARDYWLTDFWLFGLEIPPVGYEWVRYGPDALLVNVTTGLVANAVYDDFG